MPLCVILRINCVDETGSVLNRMYLYHQSAQRRTAEIRDTFRVIWKGLKEHKIIFVK